MSRFPDFEFSHVGLFVFDLEKMAKFYQDFFGVLVTDQGVVYGDSPVVFMSRDARDHHQFVMVQGRTAPADSKLVNQLSFRMGSLSDLRAVFNKASKHPEVSGLRAITHGNAYSVYLKDPEGNQLEFFTDGPFYVEQPIIEPLDLSLSDEEIVAQTEASFRGRPGFRPASEWREELRQRIEAAANN